MDFQDCALKFRKEVDYSISALSAKYLTEPFNSPEQLGSSIDETFRDSILLQKLTEKFELIEFTKELSNVSGCLWR